jgi:hypothetical protein
VSKSICEISADVPGSLNRSLLDDVTIKPAGQPGGLFRYEDAAHSSLETEIDSGLGRRAIQRIFMGP